MDVRTRRRVTPRARALRLAAAAEQAVRTHPRLYQSFYVLLTRSPRLRSLMGRVKDGVRLSGRSRVLLDDPPDAPEVARRQEQVLAVRLGLPG